MFTRLKQSLKGYRVATEQEKVSIIQTLEWFYEESASKDSSYLRRRDQILSNLKEAQRVEVYSRMINPPKIPRGAIGPCFGPDFDFHYDSENKTLKVGGNLDELYLFAKSLHTVNQE